jgi:hypothetical protein
LIKYTVTHTFEYSLPELLSAREDRYKYLDKFPDLQNVTLLEERKEGNKIFQKRSVSLASSLPQVLQPLLRDTGLIEESVFYTETNTHEFTFYPPSNKSIVTISGKSAYSSISDSQSQRIYQCEVKSGVFLISGVVEAAIEEIHKHSLEKDKNSILNFLRNKPV